MNVSSSMQTYSAQPGVPTTGKEIESAAEDKLEKGEEPVKTAPNKLPNQGINPNYSKYDGTQPVSNPVGHFVNVSA
jgi:hypothetical protein